MGAVGRARPPRSDAVLAGLVAAVQLVAAASVADHEGLSALAIAVLLGEALPLAWRRAAPLVVWLVTGAAVVAYALTSWPDAGVPLGPLIAVATVVELRPPRVAGLVVVVTAIAAGSALWWSTDATGRDWWLAASLLGVAVLVGALLRTRHALLAALADNERRAALDRQRAADDARREERVRVARELHDVVAHHVMVMTVQAEASSGGARAEAPSAVFDEIAATGRDALRELRRLLTVLRDGTSRAPVEPAPGLDGIVELVERTKAAGLDVAYVVVGERRGVPDGVQLSLYRAVQEGLTNVLKHAHADHADVTLTYDADAVAVEVRDRGRGPVGSGRGFGLIGLRERAQLLDGDLQAGPGDDGGFALRLRLPLSR